MRIVIVDDELLARQRLRALVDEIGGYDVIGEAATGAEALSICSELKPEIVLLDIRMPGMNGVETAMHLAQLEPPPAVIFTTAYAEYALQAFKAHAVDYLLKPVRKSSLEEALAGARRLTLVQLAAVREAQSEHAPRTHIGVRVRGNVELIPVQDILCFRADQKYVMVYHVGGSALIDESLRALEQEFAPQFLRVHRNALVAQAFMQGLEKQADGQYRMRLRGADEGVEVSRRHVAEVRKRLLDNER